MPLVAWHKNAAGNAAAKIDNAVANNRISGSLVPCMLYNKL